ncbi:MAG: hypothetical protein IJM65_05945, partial [Bacteroidales bacterium]|nr:hypothetical protein [Bacteroidales bacterium]
MMRIANSMKNILSVKTFTLMTFLILSILCGMAQPPGGGFPGGRPPGGGPPQGGRPGWGQEQMNQNPQVKPKKVRSGSTFKV